MISVCIASYNGARFIAEQVESILPQIGPKDEIVVSDDGSSDETLAVLRRLQAGRAPQLRIVENRGEHGYTPNFENALREARGEYIFLCDQDDLWLADKVSTCVDHLQSCEMVVSDARLISADGKQLGESFFKLRHSRHGWFNQLLRFSYLGCCLAFRREILQRALPFPRNHSYCTHDNWLALVGLTFYRVRVVPRPLIAYRRHDANASSGWTGHHTTLRFKIAYRLYIIRHLIARI